MAKYKVGDSVIVRKDLDEEITMYWMDDKADWWYATDKMVDAAGQTVTIKEIFTSGGRCLYYICEGFNDHDDFWTDEMFDGLAPVPKKPRKEPTNFKVGDRVRCIKANWGRLKVGDLGTIVVRQNPDSNCVEFDRDVGGHDGDGAGKFGHCWWLTENEFELVKEEPKPEPIPTPTPTPTPINVNITVNLYENSCWYCRKGGLVDLYLAGAMGICPNCKRVCNATNALPKAHKPSNPWKKENRALTREEFDALPVGTKVYILWRWDSSSNSKRKPKWNQSGWGVKKENKCVWTDSHCRNCNQHNNDYDRCFDAYLEEPERPDEPERPKEIEWDL